MQNDDPPRPKGNPQDWPCPNSKTSAASACRTTFLMRDMLYSEVASVHGLRNVPDNPALAVEVGMQLCTTLLEPLHATFGHVSIRSAFRSAEVDSCGEKYVNVASTGRNRARHVWDQTDKKGENGITASVVVPWFVDYVRHRGRRSIVKMHGSKDLDNSYVKLVCGQLGINPEDL